MKYYKYNFDINEKIQVTENNKNSQDFLQKISSKIIFFAKNKKFMLQAWRSQESKMERHEREKEKRDQ